MSAGARRLRALAVLLAAAVAGSVATVVVRGGTTPATAPPPSSLHLSTARVVRTDLTTSVLTEGTLGYAPSQPVVNQLAGTYTALPSPSSIIRPGEVLYRVDDTPAVLMLGNIPAWRTFTAGMTSGPDVSELQTDLVRLGFARGLLAGPNGAYDLATEWAVERWQSANGVSPDGVIRLGEMVFLPASVRVAALHVAAGEPATPGDTPFDTTSTSRTVTAPLSSDLPLVAIGETVAILLPTLASTPGRVTAIEPAPPAPAGASSASSAAGQGNSPSSEPAQLLVVTPVDPVATGTSDGVAVQISVTTEAANGVLAVPILALLALAGGGYALEVVEPSGAHRLVAVTTGVFTASQVQVSGRGVVAGIEVVVAQ